MEQRMDNQFRDFQDEIREEINRFCSALMGAFGKNLAVESTVCGGKGKAQKTVCHCTVYGVHQTCWH